MRAARTAALLFLLAAAGRAHVGSPNVFFDGEAGPWPVRVIVRPPEVVPGLAEITVRIKEGRADRVTVQPVHYQTGLKGAPPSDVAKPVPGVPGLYSGQLWLMIQGSYSIRVRIEGGGRNGVVLVPVTTAPTRLKEMRKGLGAVLSVLGLVLFAGAVTLAGAAVRESVLAPGEARTPAASGGPGWSRSASDCSSRWFWLAESAGGTASRPRHGRISIVRSRPRPRSVPGRGSASGSWTTAAASGRP